MLKEKAFVLGRLNALIDLALSVAAFFIAYWLRVNLLGPYVFPELFKLSRIPDQIWLLVLLPPLTVFISLLNGQYAPRQAYFPAREEIRRAITSTVEAALATLAIFFLMRQFYWLSRGQLIVIPAVQILLISGKILTVRKMLQLSQRSGRNVSRVVFVGSGPALKHFLETLNTHPVWGFRVEGILSDDHEDPVDQGKQYGYPVVGHIENTLDFLWDHHVDEVIFVPSKVTHLDLAPILENCEEMGIRTHLSLNAFWHRIARPGLSRFEDIPVVTYSPVRPVSTALVVKAVLDRVGSFLLLVLLAPLFGIIALAIRLTSKRGEPVFYGQTRCGLNGKPFTCWKFRSMRVGAEREVKTLRSQNLMSGPAFKMRDDPRITRLGRILRRTSIDELPQLYNVLMGDMSLVGPRPPIPDEVLRYDHWQRRRLSMKPGITCLWQVSGRNILPFETWMRLDLQYIDNWSLLLDLKILARTVLVVVTGYGAM
jgi:exopolysaccharide biosynthesis polyprenyl glycosylphosphotransferase